MHEGISDFEQYYDSVHIAEKINLNDEQKEHSSNLYNKFREESDQAIKIGVFGIEVEEILSNPETTVLSYSRDDLDETFMPLLIPINSLEWYNSKLLCDSYGDESKILLYAHPPLINNTQKVWQFLHEKLTDGNVIIFDQYRSDLPTVADFMNKIIHKSENDNYTVEAVGGGDIERKVDVFAGKVSLNGVGNIKNAPTLFEVYEESLNSGEINRDENNGVTIERSLTGDDAERLWQIYQKPFDDLSENDPTYAGFTKSDLLGILENPDIAKIVNRIDGTITTLCFFVQDFKLAPWFNWRYYQKKYPEYATTDNIFMFPGIVSDENMRGNNYSLDVIDFTTKLFAKRDTNFLVTFECTEISTQYIPEIVKSAVEHSGVAKIEGLENPISVIDYKAIIKK